MTLPNFKGTLAAAPWSGIKLSAFAEQSLKDVALKQCPACGGRGYLGGEKKPLGSVVEPCHCVISPPERRGR